MSSLERLRSGALAGAQRLDLSCGLTELPPEVLGLADSLEVLNLTGNRLTTLPHTLAGLRHLKVLFCSDNLFTHLPEVLGDCPSLEMVGFKANQIVEVPADSLPPRLRWLTLTDNAIATLPSALGERPRLQKLLLACNRLRQLPSSMVQLTQLEVLRVAANQLTEVPPWLTALPRLTWLALAGNAMGWQVSNGTGHNLPALARVPWEELHLGRLLGEGASGRVFQVRRKPRAAAGSPCSQPEAMALKVFKGAATSDGWPQHEMDAGLTAGQHPSLCTPIALVADHPSGAPALLMPLLSSTWTHLADPPSLQSCSRDVYPPTLRLSARAALRMARDMAQALAHLHQRGVMHGDFYAHNIRSDVCTGASVLSDFGAATLLPAAQPALWRALCALEARAMGVFLSELGEAASSGPADGGALALLRQLAVQCLATDPIHRPSLADVAAALEAG